MKILKISLIALFVSMFGLASTTYADPNHCDVNDQVKWEKHIKECGPYPTTTTVAPSTTIEDRELPNTGSNTDTIAIIALVVAGTGVVIFLVSRRK
jgi:LPXTG-motif cell wall-anchored protein